MTGAEGEGAQDQATDLRPYVVTGGRTEVSDRELPVEALVRALPSGGRPAGPEQRAIVAVTRDAYLSVAEIATAVRLPLGVVRVLVCDLVDAGHVTVSGVPAPAGPQRRPRHLLEQVLDGIERL
ncbi:DUF742 domain-containing protein [Cellulomonas denverensis]|uniref:DUF742 domain-containing protein n=1 Tax=Cellulomonas denverensis TaxID=264297 RepID=UPI0019442CBB|nr:DUF742 domain-containing protein [Cellulomonas denverensis]GIG26157.1 hypothetical protein Cde04nite_24010 [Cellulomonas denverensis]